MAPKTTSQPALTRHLARLPRELIHQVITDLPIVKILQILASKIPHLVEAVLTDITFQHLFKSENIEEIVSTFELYRNVMLFRRVPISQDTILGRHYRLWPPGDRVELWQLQRQMIREIEYEINRLEDIDWDVLRPFISMPVTEIPDGDDIQSLRLRWKIIKKAKRSANDTKAAQLNASADLLAEFPGKLMLKTSRDPSQDGPRSNQKHIEGVLRHVARKARNDRRLVHGAYGRCIPGVDMIQLVPYDKHLWFFIDTLERFPSKEIELNDRIQKISLSESKNELLEPFQYPSDIVKKIEIVMGGLWNLYTDMPQPVPRVKIVETAGHDPKFLGGRLNFFVSTEPHPKDLPAHLHRCRVKRSKCHDEREYEWLRAFLAVVTWMEKNIGT